MPKVLNVTGTKSDLREDQETMSQLLIRGQSMVTAKEAHKLARSIGAHTYIECSALSDTNVDEVCSSFLVEDSGAATQKSKKCWQLGGDCVQHSLMASEGCKEVRCNLEGSKAKNFSSFMSKSSL